MAGYQDVYVDIVEESVIVSEIVEETLSVNIGELQPIEVLISETSIIVEVNEEPVIDVSIGTEEIIVEVSGWCLPDGFVANIILANGSVPFTANQSLAGYKLTAVAKGTDPTDSVNMSQINIGSFMPKFLLQKDESIKVHSFGQYVLHDKIKLILNDNASIELDEGAEIIL